MIARLIGMRLFDIEASSLCNVSCEFCPREELPETGNMDEATFGQFLKNVPLGRADGLMFVGLGEPLANPLLPSFLSAAKKRYPKLFTLVTTNGKLLTRRVVPRLLDAGLDVFDVSFNGLDRETYEYSMKGAHFAETLENIDYTRWVIARTKSASRLQINYIVTEENASNEEAIRSFWRARGINRFRVQKMHTRSGLVSVDGMTPGGVIGLNGRKCEKFRHMPFITWRGDVTYCSHDLRRSTTMGNICRDNWSAIENRRQEILTKNLWLEMCDKCSDGARFTQERELSQGVIEEVKRMLPFGNKESYSNA